MKNSKFPLLALLAATALNATQLTPACQQYKKDADALIDWMEANAKKLGVTQADVKEARDDQSEYFIKVAKMAKGEQDQICKKENEEIKQLQEIMSQSLKAHADMKQGATPQK